MKFTIFTGCYNSSNFIERVFKSLKAQEYKNFEWIVIDDASQDNTVELLYQFKDKNPVLDIKIIELKENIGVAENRRTAINMAKGDFFVTWDHDDEQLPNQLSLFYNNWKKFGTKKVANLFGFCQDQDGKIRGKLFPKGTHVSNYFTYYRKYFMSNIVKQEKHVCTLVSVLKSHINYIFPEGYRPNGEILWAKIALEYDSIFINEVVRTYYIEDSIQNNMSSVSRSKSANTIYKMKNVWVNHFIKKIKHEPTLVLRIIFAQIFYGFLSNRSLIKISKDVNSTTNKFMIFCMAIPAKVLLWKMKISRKGL